MNSSNGFPVAQPDTRPIADALAESLQVLRLVHDYGQEFTDVLVPSWTARERHEEGDCYRTAFWLMGTTLTKPVHTGPLVYAEGVALHPAARGQVVEHAWLLTNEGAVVDPTWADRAPDCTYLGIPLRDDFVRRLAMEAKQFGVLHLLDATTIRQAIRPFEVPDRG